MAEHDRELKGLFDEAKRLGIAEAEALLKTGSALTIRTFEGEVEAFSLSEHRALGVRVVRDGREGCSYTEDLSADRLKACLREAWANAALLEAKEPSRILSFPEPDASLDLFDPGMAGVPVEDKIRKALELEKAALEADPRVKKVPQNAFVEDFSRVRVANTLGLDRAYEENLVVAYCVALAEEKDSKKTSFDFREARRFEDVDAGAIGRRAAEKALRLLGAKEIQSGEYPVLLDNESAADLLDTFSSVFDAQDAQEGRSILRGRLGEEIGQAELSIIDDGTLKEGFASRPFDDEGCPSRRTELVSGGVFKSFLHNSKTARKDGVESTGNGSRSVKGTLRISPANLHIAPGKASESDLLGARPRFVKIVSVEGLHAGADAVSGDFSLSAQGILYENGNPAHAVHNFTVSGNFIKMLKDIEAIGSDFKFNSSSVGSPSLLVRGLTLGGL